MLLKAAVLETISDIDLSVSGACSLVLRDLSEILTLPYLGAFDVRNPTTDSSQPTRDPRHSKRVTYIALTKKVMPMLRDVFLRFKDKDIIYIDGTLEAVFSVISPHCFFICFMLNDNVGICGTDQAEV